MISKVRARYEGYKAKSFFEQNLRVINSTFIVFSFWNAIRLIEADLSSPLALLVSIFAGFVGSLGEIFLVLSFSWIAHLCTLPFAVAIFWLVANRNPLFGSFLVFALSITTLVLVRFVIWMTNIVNRL